MTSCVNLEQRAEIRRLARSGLGWEDICVKLGISYYEGRQKVRELTLFHVKHLQPVIQQPRQPEEGTMAS